MSQVLDEAGVRHVARLARVAVPEERIAELTLELARVLDYMAVLERVDVAGAPLELGSSPWRSDDVVPSLPREVALAGARSATDSAFVVPKVVG